MTTLERILLSLKRHPASPIQKARVVGGAITIPPPTLVSESGYPRRVGMHARFIENKVELATLDQELSEIRSRHERLREYHRVRNAARRRRGPENETNPSLVGEPHTEY